MIRNSGLCFTFASLVAILGSANALDNPDYSTPAGTIDALVKLVEPTVETLDHAVYVYHYRPQSSADSVSELRENSAAMYSTYVRNTAYRAKPVQFYNSMLGDGLYAANDPVTSQGYGGDDWLLFQFRVARGSRIWNTGSQHVVEFPNDLQNALAKHFACSAESQRGLVDSGACYGIRAALLKKLDVTAIAYSFYSGYMNPTICPNQSDLAFYFTNLVPFRQDDIQIFDNNFFDLGNGFSDNRKAIAQISYFATNSSDSKPLWPMSAYLWTLDSKQSLHEAAVWAQKNLYDCAVPKAPPR